MTTFARLRSTNLFWMFLCFCVYPDECIDNQLHPPTSNTTQPSYPRRQFADFSLSSTSELSNTLQSRIDILFQSQQILHQQRSVIQQIITHSVGRHTAPITLQQWYSPGRSPGNLVFNSRCPSIRNVNIHELFERLRQLRVDRDNVQLEINQLLREQEVVDRQIDNYLSRICSLSQTEKVEINGGDRVLETDTKESASSLSLSLSDHSNDDEDFQVQTQSTTKA